MSNNYTYTQYSKIHARHTSFLSAVQALTTHRQTSCCVERNYVRRVYDYFVLNDEDSDNKSEALKIDPTYISNWEKLHDSCIGHKKPEDLTVCYLCGPEPNNDFLELTSLGILPQNIWAFETNSEAYRAAVSCYGSGVYPQPRILKQGIETFFQHTPKKFDIIYIDACGSIPSQQHALRCVSNAFFYHRLTSPGVIISNFSTPNQADASIREYYDLVCMYLYFKDHPNENITLTDVGIINDSFTDLYESVMADFGKYYGIFISAVLRDIPSIIVPTQRVSKNPYMNQLFKANCFTPITDINDVNKIKNNSLTKYLFILDILKKKELLDSKTALLLKEFGNADDLYSGLQLLVDLKEGQRPLTDEVDRLRKYFDIGINMHQFLDKPHSNLFFDAILNQLSYPMHCNVNQSKSITYRAKATAMYCDVTIYDECRYIYEWLPAVNQIKSAFDNLSWQYVFRFALDGLVKMRRDFNNEFFFQGTVIPENEDGFKKSSYNLRERII